MTPDAPRNLERDLCEVGRRIGAVKKTGRNEAHGYRFVESAHVVSKAAPLLHAAGIVVVPEVLAWDIRPTASGKGVVAVVHMAVRFQRGRDDSVTSVVLCEGLDTQDKAASKAITQGLKKAYMTVLGLAVDEGLDDRPAPEIHR